MKDFDEGKREAGLYLSQNRFAVWLDNFWYHYKWQTIAAAFCAFLLIFCFSQCAQKESYDIMVNFTGGYTLSADEQEAIAGCLNAVAPKGADGAKMHVALSSYSFYTEEELLAAYTDGDGVLASVAYANAKSVNVNHFSEFKTYLMTGECAVYFVSQAVYEQMNRDYLVPLSETFETVPANAVDDYAVKLSQTDFGQYYDAVKRLPEDTLVVLSKSYVWGASSKADRYASFVALYKTVVGA